MTSVIDERALSKLRWRCRRGLLENDLFIDDFFRRYASTLTERQAQGLRALMDLSDNDLLDLLLRRSEPEGELLQDDVVEVLRLLRRPPYFNPKAGDVVPRRFPDLPPASLTISPSHQERP